MKNRFKLLVLVLALLATVAIIASCDFGGGGDDTTTAATTTTTAAAGIPQEELDKIHYKNLADEIVFDGRPLDSSDVGVNKPTFLKASYTFQQINPADGTVIADLGATYPTNVGTYRITSTFSWQTGAQDLYPGATLPEPVSATFEIVPGDANRASAFGVKALNLFYYPNMNYDPITATGIEQFTTGTLPNGVSFAGASIEELASADATSGTAVAGGKITKAGIYKVTVNYAQDGENYTAASLAGKSAVITVIECPNQVLRKDNVAVDGVLDAAYLQSAHLEGRDQAYNYQNGIYTLLGDNIVDPMREIPMLKIEHGAEAGEEGSQLEVDVYALWGAMEGKTDAYVYLAVVVKDPTDSMRSEAYCAAPNPWLNDGIEVYYNFGGYVAPAIPRSATGLGYSSTYPTYSALANNSAARDDARPTAVDLQMSYYFDKIVFASTREVDGNGGVTYICEYAFPAKSETTSGAVGPQFQRHEGEALEAGEFLYFAFQFNDLTDISNLKNPLDAEGDDASYDMTFPSGAKYPNYNTNYKLELVKDSDWYKFETAISPYIASYGNRSSWYLMHDQGGPSYFQLSSTVAQ